MTKDIKNFCPDCGKEGTLDAKFCSNCGFNLGSNKTKFPLKSWIIAVVVSALLLGILYPLQDWFLGKAPSSTKNTQISTRSGVTNPHSKDSSSPSSNSAQPDNDLISQAEKILEKLSNTQTPDSADILEAVDLLSRIIQGQPDNSWALLQMAEISFAQKLFDKSSEFYEKYLKLEPQDIDVQVRYASSLTFSGKAEQGLKELEKVLEIQPEHFQALAFSAIAQQELGQTEKAQVTLAKAITLAPNDEARTRLSSFAQSLKVSPNQKDAATTSQSPQTNSTLNNNTAGSLETYIKNNQVAGPKFVRLDIVDQTANIYFRAFPMQQMPPMVKEKFLNNLIAEAKKETQTISELKLLDADNQAVLAQVPVL